MKKSKRSHRAQGKEVEGCALYFIRVAAVSFLGLAALAAIIILSLVIW